MKKSRTYDVVTIAIVAALYVILTVAPGLNAISYGPVQFRISEMLNFTAFYNKKYIIAVTIGCMISNFLSFTWVDVIVGGLSTLVFLSLGVLLFERFKKQYLFNGQLNKAFLYFAIFFSISMVTIAIELYYIAGLPFWIDWATLALGEFASLIVGAFIIDKLGKRIDLTK
ncbi:MULTISPECIES: QueT transporter family protein [Lactococcus]|uniref:Queuosine transporter QueT n=2 Tax=Lactococcus TaxID=1357 RepID=A0A387B828_9LACT|nr:MULTISPECIES: QueT transporter family protein [Lactococcus]AYF99964.1 queuosine transporter QueT [Lactococcus allomyrinae]MCL2112616.1 QueT transporter family protein [Streptococcaceae bacterium]QDK70920.1 queuosine transporter QueT [Lactococcus protaetiae]